MKIKETRSPGGQAGAMRSERWREDEARERVEVVLEGEIDHHRALELRGELDELIMQRRPAVLCLDMQGIGFMDSSGLGLVMGRYKKLCERGGELVIRKPSASVRRMLTMAAMERFVRIEI